MKARKNYVPKAGKTAVNFSIVICELTITKPGGFL